MSKSIMQDAERLGRSVSKNIRRTGRFVRGATNLTANRHIRRTGHFVHGAADLTAGLWDFTLDLASLAGSLAGKLSAFKKNRLPHKQTSDHPGRQNRPKRERRELTGYPIPDSIVKSREFQEAVQANQISEQEEENMQYHPMGAGDAYGPAKPYQPAVPQYEENTDATVETSEIPGPAPSYDEPGYEANEQPHDENEPLQEIIEAITAAAQQEEVNSLPAQQKTGSIDDVIEAEDPYEANISVPSHMETNEENEWADGIDSPNESIDIESDSVCDGGLTGPSDVDDSSEGGEAE